MPFVEVPTEEPKEAPSRTEGRDAPVSRGQFVPAPQGPSSDALRAAAGDAADTARSRGLFVPVVDELPEGANPDDPGILQQAIDRAVFELGALGRGGERGAKLSTAGLSNTTANLFMVLDRAAEMLEAVTPGERGGAFAKLERHYREQARRWAAMAPPEEERPSALGPIGEVAGGLPVSLLQAGGAVAVGGPVAGFAGLGALERADQGALEAAKGAAEGAFIGKVFSATGGMKPGTRSGTVGAAGAGVAAAEGAEPEDIALEGLTLGILAGTGGGKRLPRVRRESTLRPAETKIGETRSVGSAKSEVIRLRPKTQEEADAFLGRDFSDLSLPDRVVNLNLRRIEGPADFKKTLAEVTDFYRNNLNEARRQSITLEQTEAMARDMGMTPEQLLKRRKGQAFNAEELLAARKLHMEATEQFFDLSKKIRDGRASDAEKSEFLRSMALVDATAQQVAGATAEAGRALSAMRIAAKSERARTKEIQDLIERFENGRGMSLREFSTMASALDRPEAVSGFARDALKPSTSQKLQAIWINWLVSGPQTQSVNILSNELVAFYAVPETFLAGTIGAARARLRGRHSSERVYLREGNARLFGLVQGMGEGLRAAGKVLRTGEVQDPVTKLEVASTRSFESRAANLLFELPGRGLLAGDALFKAIGQRQEINALAIRDGVRRGLRGRDLAQHVERLRRNPTEEMIEKAIEAGREQTFTNPLGEKGRGIVKATNGPVRIIVPFRMTPINIFKFSMKRSPFGPLLKEVREDFQAGGVRRDTAIARISLGSALSAWAAAQAASGTITGGGPTDPEARAAWFAAGNLPYSINVAGRRVSFARLEPLGTLLGVAADFSEIAGQLEKGEREELAAKIAMSFSRNISNKTFVKGLSEAALAISDPDRYGSSFVENLAGTLVPNVVSQVNRTTGIPGISEPDPVLRDVQNSLDAIKAKLPNYSRTIPPLPNIWGEPIVLEGGLGPDLISPLYQNTKEPDHTTQEVERVGAELSKPDRTIRGVELTPWEYYKYTKVAGKLAKAEIDAFVSSPVYPAIPDGLKKEMMERFYVEARAKAREFIILDILENTPERFQAQMQERFQDLLSPAE